MRDYVSFFRRLYSLSMDIDFRRAQNKLAENAYDVLAEAYSSSTREREEIIVKKICEAFNNFSFPGITIKAQTIHGSGVSGVKFRNALTETKIHEDGLVKKEMADMVVIAIATEKDRILFEKIAFIQNKQEVFQKNIAGVQIGKRKWQIDQDQLFLLQNFPTFRAEGSVFPKRGYTLHNFYGKLGNYGLFLSPGEMVFANTKLVAAAQSDKDKKNNVKVTAKSEEVPLSFDKLRSISLLSVNQPCYFPFLSPCHCHDVNNCYRADCEEFFHLSKKLGYNFFQMPFLRSVDFTFNIYDFIRNWTMFGIGEPVTVFGKPLDPGLSHISGSLLQKIRLSFTRDTSYDEWHHDEWRFLNEGEEDRSVFGPGTVVLAVHYNIEQ